ncbi:MAG: RNA polymerase sigma factor, partial [candidate division WOR-3 bacterium]
HQQGLHAFIYRMVSNQSDAEELAQQAFVRAWQKLAGFKGRSSFKTWLYQIAINLTLNFKTRTRPTEELNELQPADPATEPQTDYHRRQQEELIQQALLQLPVDQRTALVLKVYENLSYNEIARVMGRSVRAVDSLLVRARARLRTLLEPARQRGLL